MRRGKPTPRGITGGPTTGFRILVLVRQERIMENGRDSERGTGERGQKLAKYSPPCLGLCSRSRNLQNDLISPSFHCAQMVQASQIHRDTDGETLGGSCGWSDDCLVDDWNSAGGDRAWGGA